MMSAPVVKAWQRDAQGNHYPCPYCPWQPCEETRMTALWLKFWHWLDARGKGYELRTVRTLCACGHSIEHCPCAFTERG